MVCTFAEGKEVRVTVSAVVVLPVLGTVTPAQPERQQAKATETREITDAVRARYKLFWCVEGG